MKKEVVFAFFISASMLLFKTAIFPDLRFHALAPFLVILYLHSGFLTSLWIALLLGFFQDLLSSSPMGLNSLAYLLITTAFYRQKKTFSDKPINLVIFTMIISIIYSLIEPILLAILDKGFPISFKWFITDLIIMPIIDGLYAFIGFAMPLMLLDYTIKNVKKLIAKNRG